MFKEFEISNFTGIATSKRSPNKSECLECKNFDTRFIDGDLTLRPGFVTKYTAIANADHRSKLSLTYLGFENFYSPEGSGQEITTWVTKSVLTGESTGQTLGTPTSINVLAIFTSHRWTGSAWSATNWDGSTSGKYWLNHCVLTKIKTVNASRWKLELDFTDADLITASMFDKWTIANISKSPVEYQKVILTYDYDGGGGNSNPGVEITSETHTWAAGDTVLLMRNYIPYDELVAMGHPSSGVTSAQLNFSKVINDLRISFGGYENRIALTVGYRKTYLGLSSIDFGSYTSNQIETFATTDGLILEPYNTYGMVASSNPEIIPSGTLTAGNYFFKIIATTDNFNKYFISENLAGFASASDIRINPSMVLGTLPKRITSVAVYWASGGVTDKEATSPYFLLKQWTVSANTYEAFDWKLSSDGTLHLEDTFTANLHTSRNAVSSASNTVLTGSIDPAASTAVVGVGTLFTSELVVGDQILVSGETRTVTVITDDLNLTVGSAFTDNANDTSPERLAEANRTTDWASMLGHNDITLSSVTATPAPHGGTYCMKIVHSNATDFDARVDYPIAFELNTNYKFDFWVYGSVEMDISIWFVYGIPYWTKVKTVHISATTWTNIIETLNTGSADPEYGTPTKIGISGFMSSSDYFALDDVIINKSDLYSDLNSTSALVDDDELTDNLGYQDTYDYAKSWDQAIVTQGRSFIIGAYIDKRYTNLIFTSHISGDGAFMYDVITAGRYLSVEGKDDPVAVEVLPNLDLIVIKKNSVQYTDPNTGISRGIYFVDGAISRRSVVNFGDKIVWCGENDIYMSDGINVLPLTDGTIREDYRTWISALGSGIIIATREERDNAYRVSIPVSGSEVEYILTKKGWVKRINAGSVVPDAFITARDGTIWFMDAGVIYYDYTSISLDNATSLTAEWKSIEFDCELIGEGLTGFDFFYVDAVWMDFTIIDTVALDMTITLSIYLDGSSTAYKSFVETYTYSAPAVNFRQKIFRRFLTTNARRFSIGIALSGTGVLGKTFELHSVGVMWKPGQRGWHNA